MTSQTLLSHARVSYFSTTARPPPGISLRAPVNASEEQVSKKRPRCKARLKIKSHLRTVSELISLAHAYSPKALRTALTAGPAAPNLLHDGHISTCAHSGRVTPSCWRVPMILLAHLLSEDSRLGHASFDVCRLARQQTQHHRCRSTLGPSPASSTFKWTTLPSFSS